MIAMLGLGLPGDIMVGPQLFTVRTIDLQNSMERYYQRFYINIDRRKFDSWLISLVPVAVDLRLGCSFKSFERAGGNFKLRFVQNDSEYIERARFLVGADGAFSMVRRLAFPNLPEPIKYTAVQEWFYPDEILPSYYRITNHHGKGGEKVMAAERYYYMGDFENSEIAMYNAFPAANETPQSGIIICAVFQQIKLALMKGDFNRILQLLKQLREDINGNKLYLFMHTLDMCEAYIYAGLNIKEPIQPWIKNGEFKNTRLLFPAMAYLNIVTA